jgi:hypothetical protein
MLVRGRLKKHIACRCCFTSKCWEAESDMSPIVQQAISTLSKVWLLSDE